jgi:hypothetical protein
VVSGVSGVFKTSRTEKIPLFEVETCTGGKSYGWVTDKPRKPRKPPGFVFTPTNEKKPPRNPRPRGQQAWPIPHLRKLMASGQTRLLAPDRNVSANTVLISGSDVAIIGESGDGPVATRPAPPCLTP